MKWIGWIAASLAVVGGVCLGSEPRAFLNIPSLLFVGLMGGGVVVAAHGTRAWRLIFLTLVGRLADESREEAHGALQTAVSAFIAAGWIGVIIGVVQMLTVLDDPAKIGPGMAVALLTALYGHVIAYAGWMPLARSIAVRN